jgi:hypothetical protein
MMLRSEAVATVTREISGMRSLNLVGLSAISQNWKVSVEDGYVDAATGAN